MPTYIIALLLELHFLFQYRLLFILIITRYSVTGGLVFLFSDLYVNGQMARNKR